MAGTADSGRRYQRGKFTIACLVKSPPKRKRQAGDRPQWTAPWREFRIRGVPRMIALSENLLNTPDFPRITSYHTQFI